MMYNTDWIVVIGISMFVVGIVTICVELHKKHKIKELRKKTRLDEMLERDERARHEDLARLRRRRRELNGEPEEGHHRPYVNPDRPAARTGQAAGGHVGFNNPFNHGTARTTPVGEIDDVATEAAPTPTPEQMVREAIYGNREAQGETAPDVVPTGGTLRYQAVREEPRRAMRADRTFHDDNALTTTANAQNVNTDKAKNYSKFAEWSKSIKKT